MQVGKLQYIVIDVSNPAATGCLPFCQMLSSHGIESMLGTLPTDTWERIRGTSPSQETIQ